MKMRMIEKVHAEDPGIMGAYRLYLNDRDQQAFKMRTIHKFLGGHLGTAGTNSYNGLS